MSIFGRKKDDAPDAANGPESVSVPAARDPDLGVPAYRPPPSGSQTVGMPPKPGAAPAPRPGVPAAGAAPRAPRPEAGHERRTLVVGRGISLQGTVTDAERLVVEGTVESQMIQAAELAVGPTGVFRGEVQVEDAEIAGLFDGTITVRGNLVIRASGKVKGTVRYRKLSVEEGGTMMGSMEMLPGEG
ncbi:bactofilin family protein [Rubritepida flocculans]|uniref:bactofilin family protein n=1 Tax=Rubritepida flocculans TaxID=182403 RepID=UPI0004037884|nr:polymer-forming cytoskeletal protein [Rubritepida flocculans]